MNARMPRPPRPNVPKSCPNCSVLNAEIEKLKNLYAAGVDGKWYPIGNLYYALYVGTGVIVELNKHGYATSTVFVPGVRLYPSTDNSEFYIIGPEKK